MVKSALKLSLTGEKDIKEKLWPCMPSKTTKKLLRITRKELSLTQRMLNSNKV
jgi:hypothetical protein